MQSPRIKQEYGDDPLSIHSDAAEIIRQRTKNSLILEISDVTRHSVGMIARAMSSGGQQIERVSSESLAEVLKKDGKTKKKQSEGTIASQKMKSDDKKEPSKDEPSRLEALNDEQDKLEDKFEDKLENKTDEESAEEEPVPQQLERGRKASTART